MNANGYVFYRLLCYIYIKPFIMKNFIKSKVGRFLLYSLLCVFVFTITNLLFGWLLYDYNHLSTAPRPALATFIVLNLFIDFIAIMFLSSEIDLW